MTYPKPTLLPIEQALTAILSSLEPVTETETVPLNDALGRVLADDQYSSIDVPPCDNSAMDGYAVHYDDLVQCGYKLRVSQRIAAGYIGKKLDEKTAARIFTGAAIPERANTIIMQEDTTSIHIDSDEAIHVIDSAAIKSGQHIRPQGQDIAAGSIVVARGKKLQPQDIGLLASVGVISVSVYRRLKVAVLSTGDELVEPGQPLTDGQIYNSNRFTLMALLSSLGCEAIDSGIIADDFEATCDQLKAVVSRADIVISSGGVSVGEEDYVKAAVENLGELSLWRLNIKPGKPFAFGNINGTPFFGLPGNPSSVFVTFCILVRPYLLAHQGLVDFEPLLLSVKAGFDRQKAGSRQEYLRAKIIMTPKGAEAKIYANQSSGVLSSMSWANALVVVPAGTTIARGDKVQSIVLNELLH